MVISSLMVVTVQNSVYSVLFLVLSFICASVILFLLECEFIALIFITIYVGAIAVLFLFVVMMLDVKINKLKKDSIKYFPFAIVLGGVFLIEILTMISDNFKYNYYNISTITNSYVNWYDKIDSFSEISSIGQVMYTQYVIQFLVAGNVLLLATLAVVVLAVDYSKNNSKTQIIYKQLSRNSKNVLLLSK